MRQHKHPQHAVSLFSLSPGATFRPATSSTTHTFIRTAWENNHEVLAVNLESGHISCYAPTAMVIELDASFTVHGTKR